MARNLYSNAHPAAVKDMVQLVEGISQGDRISAARFQERLGTVDGAFAFANLTNVTLQNWFGTLPSIWNRFAGQITVQDFRNVHVVARTLDYSNFKATDKTTPRPSNVIPQVAEGEKYQNFSLTGTALGWAINKSGAAIGFTWEALVNDVYNTVGDLPKILAESAVRTYDWNATNALWTTANADSASGLAANTLFGTLVNSPLNINAINAAKQQLALRKAPDGTYLNAGKSFVLNYSPALQGQVDYLQNLTLLRRKDTSTTGGVTTENDSYYETNLGDIDFVNNQFLAFAAGGNSAAWVLSTAPDGTDAPVVSAFLAGEEVPEVRVSGLAGYTVNGAQLPYTSGSFDTDTFDMRVRVVNNAGPTPFGSLETVWSTGLGS